MQPLQPSSSMSMLQSRPVSSDAFSSSNNHQSYQHQQRGGHTPRSMYNNGSQGGYRGTSGAPVQPYAFQSTPHLRQESRTISAPQTATFNHQPSMAASITNNAKHGWASPTTTAFSRAQSPGGKRSPTKDDLLNGDRPSSVISLSSSIPDLSLTNFDVTPKTSPNRYRRNLQRSESGTSSQQTTPTGSGMSSVEHLYTPPQAVIVRTASDDLQAVKNSEAAKRYRRRSMGNLESSSSTSSLQAGQPQRPSSQQGAKTEQRSPSSTIRPVASHNRSGSNDSTHSRSRDNTVTPPPQELENVKGQASPNALPSSQRRDTSPARASNRGATDGQKRMNNPSPLSRSAYTRDAQSPPQIVPSNTQAPSPAAQHLAALSDRDLNKGMKSRLRRAFSFGSAAELRKASAGENTAPVQRRVGGPGPEGLDDEQAEIARRQEAAGIGAGIYSGQGGFAGSTDNLSISSTASSASIMLRKMGKGVKKGGRNLKGLFRPKSVIGVPAADGPVQPSLAQVSMVTVEAERQKVNVNINPSDQVGGGTGFPKLERNSMDVGQTSLDTRSSNERTDSMRKSIVGSEKDRAEVLAAVKKGILKRSSTSSPQSSPIIRPQGAAFTDGQVTVSPASSMPGTPRDERHSHSLTSTNSSSDYFSRANGSAARSMPSTPQSSRNISFSPRIQFHDVWSSTEYDRRGDIATCNRLTPMLAQQIKEELNTFKMVRLPYLTERFRLTIPQEMEVHEQSKPHTHFF